MKRIFSLWAIVIVFVAMFAISANAAMVYSENFDIPPESGNLKDLPEWTPEPGASAECTYMEDGAIKMINRSELVLWTVKLETEDNDNIVKFDAKVNEGFTSGPYVYYTGKSGWRVGTVYLTCPTADTWYTFLFQTKTTPDGLMAYAYRKPTNSDEEYVCIKSVLFSEKTGSPNIIFGIGKTGMEFWLDNFEVHTGTYISEIGFEADGVEIATPEDITEGMTELKMSASVYNSDMVSEEMSTTEAEVLPVVLAFDKKGMMLDCAMTASTMKAFENSYEVTLPIEDYASEISRIEFYLWDSIFDMNPVFKPYVLQ